MSDNRWSEITVLVDGDRVEFISDLLLARGAVSVLVEGEEDRFETEIGEIPDWPVANMAAIFDLDSDNADAHIKSVLEELTSLSLEAKRRDFPDQNWELVSLERYQPQQIVDSLWVVPDWHEPPIKDAINIFCNPGLAFGTGEHPTTRGCMRVLYRLARQGKIGGKSVLDMGCGSGILAVTAVKLGAKSADATDIDPRALDVTGENSEKNEVSSCIRVISLDKLPPMNEYDIVIANILAGTLIEIADSLQRHVKEGGILILSGILAGQVQRVQGAYGRFSHWQSECEDDWVTLYGYG